MFTKLSTNHKNDLRVERVELYQVQLYQGHSVTVDAKTTLIMYQLKESSILIGR